MEFIKITEQPSLYDDLDKKSVKEILEDINTEDHKVADAVQKAIPQIEKLVTLIIPRVKKGGRIFYMGAGTSGRLGVLDASEIPPTFGMPPRGHPSSPSGPVSPEEIPPCAIPSRMRKMICPADGKSYCSIISIVKIQSSELQHPAPLLM